MKLTQKIAVAYLRGRFRIVGSLLPRKAGRDLFHFFSTPHSRNTNPLPPVFLQAEKLQFIFRKENIVGYRWNNGANRKALIIHGFESSVINFHQFVPFLIEKGYEVLAFDAPANGRSSGKELNAVDYRDFIREICVKYGPVQSFIAHSFGGLALCLALEMMPQHDTNRLVLIAPLTESTTAAEHLFNLLRIRNPLVKEEFDRNIEAVGGHPLAWFSIARILPALQGKILWIHDENDLVTPIRDVLKIDMGSHAAVQLMITKELGHSMVYRDPEVGKAIAKFL